MRNQRFDVPVTISEQAGCLRIITDTIQAAEVLLRRWPVAERRDHAYLTAVQTCLDVMEGRKESRAAREAFVRAAKSADIFFAVGPRRRYRSGNLYDSTSFKGLFER